MNDFDRLLEYHLRRKLDPIVGAPAPVRRGRANRLKKESLADRAAKSHGVALIQLWPDALAFLEHS
jgi:hypothetical protein